MQELSTEKSEDLILLRERIKYLESENKFLKDDIFNPIDNGGGDKKATY